MRLALFTDSFAPQQNGVSHPNTPVAENVTRIVVEGSAERTEYVPITVDSKTKDGSLFSWKRVPLAP